MEWIPEPKEKFRAIQLGRLDELEARFCPMKCTGYGVNCVLADDDLGNERTFDKKKWRFEKWESKNG